MEEIKFSPFPALTTNRLILRRLKDSDETAVFLLRSNNVVNKYIDRPKQISISEAGEFIKKINNGIILNKWIYWAICLKNNPEPIGTVCLWNFSAGYETAEIGYELLPSFQGKGLMNEALKPVIKFGFGKIRLGKIEAFTHKENISSINLLGKNNFKLDPDRIDETNKNNIVYLLTRNL